MAIKFLNTVAVDTNVLYVDAASNEVGINTTSPAYALHVNGQIYSESSTYPVFYLKRNTSATGGAFSTLTGIASSFKLETDSTGTITDGFGGGIIFSIGDTSPNTAARIYARRDGGDQTGALQFWGGADGNTLFTTMRASGNVGIGTEAPAEKLVVSEVRSGSDAAAQTKYTLVSRSTIASNQTPGTGGIKVAYNDGSNEHAFGLVAGSSSADFLTSGPMHWYTNSDLNTQSATGFAMTIDTSQRVGIGTTNPTTDLHVEGSALVTSNATVRGDLRIDKNPSTYPTAKLQFLKNGVTSPAMGEIIMNDNPGHAGMYMYARRSSSPFTTSYIELPTSTNYDFEINLLGSNALTIDTSTRNVGIGTTNPGASLDVDSSTGIKVQNSGDVVFLANGNDGTFSLGDTGGVGGSAYITGDNSDIKFFAESSEVVTIKSTGNVGIGATNPDKKLVVNHASDTRLKLQVNGTDTAQIQTLANEARYHALGSSTSLQFWANGAKRATINTSGNFGIGEPSPAERLHISGSVDNDDVAIRIDNDSDDNSSLTPPSAAILFNAESNNGYVRVFGAPVHTAANHKMDIGATASTSYLTFSPSGSEKMRIGSNGNIGIGTTDTSSFKLDVAGSARSNFFALRGNESLPSESSAIYRPATGTFAIVTASTERMRVLDNGYIGIGTDAASEKLEVSGGAIKVTNTGAAQLILRGDSGNSGDSGNVDGIIDFIHDEGSYGYRLNTENHSGKNAFHIQDYQNSQYLSRIYIGQDGEVGIGTNSPDEKLVVSGTDDVSIRINSTKNGTWTTDQLLGAYEFFGSDASGPNSPQIKAKIDCSSVNQYGSAFNMRFFTHAGTGGTSVVERMRIRHDGIVLIGKTAGGSYNTSGIDLNPVGLGSFTRSGNVALLVNRSGSDGSVVSIRNDNTGVGSISVSGTTTSFNVNSDYRLKENIIDLSNAVDRVQQLKPRRFNFISKPELTVDGFLAHEVQNIIPEAVLGEKDAIDENGKPEYQQIDNSKIVPLLVGAIKELKAEIETLKSQIN